MAFNLKEILKGLRIVEEGTLTPKKIEVVPGGSANTTTTLQGSQTANRTVTLPDATDTLVGKATTDTLTNKTVVVANNTITTASSGNLAATELNAALSELQSDIDTRATATDLSNHLNDITDAHDASAISSVASGNLVATDVQAALNELQSDIDTRATTTDLNNHLNDTTDAHDASAISSVASGNLVATDVQAALNELQSDIDTRAITAGTLAQFAATTSAQLAGVISDETGTGALVFGTSPSLTTPNTDVVTLDGQASTPASPSAGFYKAYVKDSTQKLTILNSAGVETTVGSGSGAKNYISNGDAEASTTGWATYADAAGTRPVDGTGGSPNTTWTTTSTTPLEGSNSFLLTHNVGASRQGEGVSYDFDIDLADQGKVLSIEFDYLVNSGTFTAGSSSADSDIIVYLYDKDNSVLLEPSSFRLLSNSSTVSDRFQSYFQTASNSNSYRLILHCATTVNSDFVLKIDNIKVTPSQYSYGTPISDWTSATFTLTNFGTATVTGRERRVGDSKEFEGRIVIGASVPTGTLVLNLPSGNSIDTNKLNTTDIASPVGLATGLRGSRYPAAIIYNSTTSVYFTNTGTVGTWNATVPATWANGDSIAFKFSVPMSGLSSSIQMSDKADLRLIAAYASRSTTQSISTGAAQTIVYTSKSGDTHGAFNTSTGVYTVPVAGRYVVKATCTYDSHSPGASTQLYELIATKNLSGSAEARSLFLRHAIATGFSQYVALSGSTTFDCVAGDTLEIRTSQNSGGSINLYGSAGHNNVSIERASGPSLIAPNELVSARYSSDTAHSIAHNAVRFIDFEDKGFDSHGAVSGTGSGITTTTNTGWKFTAPITGTYQVNASVCVVIGTSLTYNCYLLLYKNGTAISSGARLDGTTNTLAGGAIGASCYDYVQLNAGERLEVGIVQANGGSAAKSLSGTAYQNYISIARVGF